MKNTMIINYLGHDITLTEITFCMDSDPALQRGLLLHDATDEHSDGDAVYPWEDITDADDLRQMIADAYPMSAFDIIDGVYHCHC